MIKDYIIALLVVLPVLVVLWLISKWEARRKSAELEVLIAKIMEIILDPKDGIMTKKSKKESSLPVRPNDMFVLLLSTIRYSLGRQTYMTSLAPELVVTYSSYLSEDNLKQIVSEIRKEVELWSAGGKPIYDESTWLDWADRIERSINQRQIRSKSKVDHQ